MAEKRKEMQQYISVIKVIVALSIVISGNGPHHVWSQNTIDIRPIIHNAMMQDHGNGLDEYAVYRNSVDVLSEIPYAEEGDTIFSIEHHDFMISGIYSALFWSKHFIYTVIIDGRIKVVQNRLFPITEVAFVERWNKEKLQQLGRNTSMTPHLICHSTRIVISQEKVTAETISFLDIFSSEDYIDDTYYVTFADDENVHSQPPLWDYLLQKIQSGETLSDRDWRAIVFMIKYPHLFRSYINKTPSLETIILEYLQNDNHAIEVFQETLQSIGL